MPSRDDSGTDCNLRPQGPMRVKRGLLYAPLSTFLAG